MCVNGVVGLVQVEMSFGQGQIEIGFIKGADGGSVVGKEGWELG